MEQFREVIMNLEGITEKVNKNKILEVKQGKNVRKKLRT